MSTNEQIMRLVIHAEVDVNVSAWELEYGLGRRPLADDVEDYILNALQESPAAQAGALSLAGFAVRVAT